MLMLYLTLVYAAVEKAARFLQDSSSVGGCQRIQAQVCLRFVQENE